MSRPGFRLALLLLCPLAAAAQGGGVEADLAELSIGVAPFERVAPPGLAPPDLAPDLAAEILARGAGRTVSPATLAIESRAEPSAEAVRELAGRHGLDALVVGRITRLGERVSLDVRLRDGGTGAVAGTYVAELGLAEPPEPVLERLAAQLVSGALALAHGSPAAAAAERPAPAARGGGAGPAPPAPAQDPSSGAGSARSAALARLDPDAPFSIRSDALEATEREDGRRILVFRDGVEARQGDLVLRAARLEAEYPEGARQPSRLRAEGGVSVAQGDREARCQRAEYSQRDQKIVCRGDALLRDGDDALRGDSIVFDLAAERVRVEGGTQVALVPGAAQDGPDAGRLGELPAEGPVAIRARQLEASQDAGGGRRIRLEGSVEVAQEDLVLRAREIEAVYPPQAREPETLVATGEVVVRQGEREARCDRAVYQRTDRRVDCTGSASLREGEDRVTGDEIAFDLEAERLVVRGGTRLVLAPRAREGGTP